MTERQITPDKALQANAVGEDRYRALMHEGLDDFARDGRGGQAVPRDHAAG